MPEGFDKCKRDGGKIRTKRTGASHYMHICFIDGKSYPGYPKEYKKILKGKKEESEEDEDAE